MSGLIRIFNISLHTYWPYVYVCPIVVKFDIKLRPTVHPQRQQ